VLSRNWNRTSRLACATFVVIAALSTVVSSSSVAAAAPSNPRLNTKPLAQLRVLTLAPSVGTSVDFSVSGSRASSGSVLQSLTINFGDGSGIQLQPKELTFEHVYRASGIYDVRLLAVDSSDKQAFTRRYLVVSGPNDVVLKKTASRVPGRDLESLVPLTASSEELTLSKGTPAPLVGHTLLVGTASLDPNGLIAVVRDVVHESDGSWQVTVHDGSLSDAYSTLDIAATVGVGSKLDLSPRSSQSSPLDSDGTTVSATQVPFSCSLSSGVTVNVTANLSDTQIGTSIDLGKLRLSFSLSSQPQFTLGVSFSGSATCELSNDLQLNIPVPEVPGLVISVGPYFSLSASGEIGANATWDPDVELSVVRGPGDSQNTFDYTNHATASGSGSASITLDAGIEVTVSLGHAAGITVSLGPEFTATVTATSSQICVAVTSDIQLEVQLFAHVFFVSVTYTVYDGHYFMSTLFNKCVSSGSSSPPSGSGSSSPPQSSSGGQGSTSPAPAYSGSTVTEIAFSDAQTWTDYADGGGTQGPDIASGQSVGVVCRLVGLTVPDGNNWWYLIGSSPWNATFYVSADPFYNGPTNVAPRNTPFVDTSVPVCSSSAGPSPTPTTQPTLPHSEETTGTAVHTFTDYSDAGDPQGPTIPSNTTVSVTCRVQGFAVADGDTWWYEIASSPWNNDYYASADPFYNNGQTSGSLDGTPAFDTSVPVCSPPLGPSSISIGWGSDPAPAGNWMDITFTNFPTGTVSWYCVEEGTSYGPYSTTLTSNTETLTANTCYDTEAGGSDYVVSDEVSSNTIPTDSSGGGGSSSISIGWGSNSAPAGNWMDITFTNFATGPVSWYCIEEGTSYGPYSTTLTSNTETLTTNTCYDTEAGGSDYVAADGIDSNTIATDAPAPPPPQSISIGWGGNPAPYGNWMDITFNNFPTGRVTWYCVEEGTSYGPYSTTLTSSTETLTTNTCYDTERGGSDYVTADGYTSNTIGTD
jgi:uncharacterized protein YwgA